MRTGKHRAHEDFQVYDIDVFYNGNLIVAGYSRFFSSIIFQVALSEFVSSITSVVHVILS